MKNVYHYFAILEPMKDGYGVYFPDLNGCVSHGKDYKEAIECAKEALELHLYGMENDKEEIPESRKPEEIEVPVGSILVLIEANMKVFRFVMKNKSITRATTLPNYLNELAKESGLNVSLVLQEALKDKLNIKED